MLDTTNKQRKNNMTGGLLGVALLQLVMGFFMWIWLVARYRSAVRN
jgi:hypothetical protein